MDTDVTVVALSVYPVLQRLVDLEAAGWTFVHRSDALGVSRVDAFRAWPGGWLDCLRVLSATDSMGIRTNGGEPPGLLWERVGELGDVVDGLITLPAPVERLAPRLVRGAAPQLWTPGQRGRV
ncbi:MAG: hypothetical protein ABIQ18_39170 [Umezawaea sp.]